MAMPIVISDDEDEEIQVIRQLQPDFSPVSNEDSIELDSEGAVEEDTKEKRRDLQLKSGKGYEMMLSMGYLPGRGLGRELDGDVDPLPLIMKRKRDENGVGCSTLPPHSSTELDGMYSMVHEEPRLAAIKRKREERDSIPFSIVSTGVGQSHSYSQSPQSSSRLPASKRQRIEDDPVIIAASSKAILQAPVSQSSSSPKPESKKTKKRRLRMERLALEASTNVKPMAEPSVCSLSCRDPNCQRLHSTRVPVASTSTETRPVHSPFSLDNLHMNASLPRKPSFSSVPPLPRLPVVDFAIPMGPPGSSGISQGPANYQTVNISVAGPSSLPKNPNATGTSGSSRRPVDFSLVNTPSQSASEPLPPPGTAIRAGPSTSALSPPDTVKKCQLPIGMPLDLSSPNSHGLFPIGSSLSSPNGPSHTPHPSRTLVMESLPRKLRDPRWVKQWCTSASGAHPAAVHVDVDPKAGKALIEFTHADLARAAFHSPRLQDNEGRGGIRVWWFRSAPTVEMEEGEIAENDDPVPQPTKPSTKKAKQKKKKPDPSPHLNSSSVPAQNIQPLDGFGFPPDMPMLHNLPGLPPLPVLPPFVQDPTSFMSTFNFHPGSSFNAYPPDMLALPLPVPPMDYNLEQDHRVHEDPNPQELQYPGDADERASIASSRPGSSSGLDPMVSPADVQTEDITEDMDISSPVSAHPSIRPTNGHGVYEDDPEPENLYREDSTPGLSKPTPLLMPLNAPLPQLAQSIGPSSIHSISNSSSITNSISPPISTPTPPSDVPSEPRAMKNAPKGPSYTKRSLMARQRELEERIARSKMELNKTSNTSALPVSVSTPTSSGAATPHVAEEVKNVDKLAMEEKLRRLVLQSKRNKALVSGSPPLKSEAPSTALEAIIASADQLDVRPPFSSASSSEEVTSLSALDGVAPSSASSISQSSETSASSGPLVTPSQSSFDELAVSFITEAIQASKPLPLRPAPSTQKLELAAKQRKLEQHIAESKALMLKLNAARTKEEKENILRVMRERSRLMEEDMKSPSATPTTTESNFLDGPSSRSINGGTFGSEQGANLRIRWPETHHDAGMLVVSDDEDDE